MQRTANALLFTATLLATLPTLALVIVAVLETISSPTVATGYGRIPTVAAWATFWIAKAV